MKLNCQPGDLAVIKRGFTCDTYVGRVIEVLDQFWIEGADEAPDAGPAWAIKFREPVLRLDGSVHNVACCPDAWLRPITPPAGTVSDEEVAELYEPSTKRTPQTA